jgi:hypothetical protein
MWLCYRKSGATISGVQFNQTELADNCAPPAYNHASLAYNPAPRAGTRAPPVSLIFSWGVQKCLIEA